MKALPPPSKEVLASMSPSRSSLDSCSIGMESADGTDISGPTTQDSIDMARLGRDPNPNLHRSFRTLSSIAFTSCCMGTWEILLAGNSSALKLAGRGGMFWSLVWCYVGQGFVVLSLAEAGSAVPAEGGQYHWVSVFAPPRFQKGLSYASGWLSTLAWESSVAVECFLVGKVVLALVVVNDGTGFEAQRWQATLLIVAVVCGLAAFNILVGRRLAGVEIGFVVLHFVAFIPIIVVLLAMIPKKKTASDVFLSFKEYGAGWDNLGLSVMVGQVSNVFVVLGSASAAQMSEEITDAALAVPRSMVWSFILNIPIAFAILLTYLFCLDSIPEALDSPSGYPFVHLFQKATGTPEGTTGLTIIVLLLLLIITSSQYAGTSRQLYAFARDGGMPCSKWLAQIHPTYNVPVNSILVTAVFTILISLINIGSTTAFNAIISLASVAIMATCGLSILCILHRRLSAPGFPQARWSLGRLGFPVNVMALVYTISSFFWSFWPQGPNPGMAEFNWSVVLFVGVVGVAMAGYFWGGGREGYVSPVDLAREKGVE